MQWNLLLIDFASGIDDSPSPADRYTSLLGLPPSAKFVYKVLEGNSPLTQSAIAEETWLSRRTIRHALSELESADLVTVELYIPDARKKLYRANPVEEPP